MTVDGHAEPWQYVNTGLNTNYQYGATPPNVPSGTAPIVVSAANGFDFEAGTMFTVSYVSGTISPGSGQGSYDANGDYNFPANSDFKFGEGYLPSYYISSISYPVYLGALVGTFTDASGAIVGSPFFLGDGPATETVPTRATQLQLGINDLYFPDNSGSLVVNVTGPRLATSTPEPGTPIRLLASCISGGLLLRKRHMRIIVASFVKTAKRPNSG